MISLTMLAIIGVGTVFVVHDARRSVREEVQSSAKMALQLIDAGLLQTKGNESALPQWLKQLALLEKTRHLRIQVRQMPEKIINLEGQPSSRSAGEMPSWFAWAVMPDMLVGERRLHGPDGAEISVLIEANPEDEIKEAWNEARSFLLMMIALAAIIYALVHITLGRAFKSVGIVLKGLEDIEQGNYGKPMPRFSLPEFDRISQAFNHTLASLSKARGENRAHTQRSLTIQEEERRHIAQELHDELGQSLSAIKVMAASLRRSANSPEAVEAVNAIMDTCDRLFEVVRSMMRSLRPMMLDELGLIASLEDMLKNWRCRNPGIRVDFAFDSRVEESAGSAKIHLFRIVQECLTNIVKHADARNVRVTLRVEDDVPEEDKKIMLQIEDDGRGFDPSQPNRGFGLKGMRERATSLGGDFCLDTGPDGGVSIRVEIPCGGRDDG
ncbi:MAG: methanol utilization protein MoxY [Proteobacteria bacterium]|nr:methanol utilization protein MoxY [Pseudomonadota bacterium]